MNLEDKKDYAGALVALREAEQAVPDDARIHNDLATVLYYLEDNDGAIAEVHEALRLSPWMVQAHFNLGAFLLHAGRTDEALPVLEQTQKMNPNFSPVEEALALVYLLEQNNGEALRHYRRGLELNPKSIAALVGATRILASAKDASLRNGAEAIKLASRANELTDGKDPIVLDTLGAAYAEVGDFEHALEAAQRALDIATVQGNDGLKEMILVRIQLYHEKHAYRK
jgi:tetratricopeptide (TPR) repeat protein